MSGLLSPLPVAQHLLSPACFSREEAKEMWEKREAQWAREQSARDRLMREVTPRPTKEAGVGRQGQGYAFLSGSPKGTF